MTTESPLKEISSWSFVALREFFPGSRRNEVAIATAFLRMSMWGLESSVPDNNDMREILSAPTSVRMADGTRCALSLRVEPKGGIHENRTNRTEKVALRIGLLSARGLLRFRNNLHSVSPMRQSLQLGKGGRNGRKTEGIHRHIPIRKAMAKGFRSENTGASAFLLNFERSNRGNFACIIPERNKRRINV
jgi:hypothetical protein